MPITTTFQMSSLAAASSAVTTPVNAGQNLNTGTPIPTTSQPSNPTTVLADQIGGVSVLRYPLDGGVYYMAFNICEYLAPSVQSVASLEIKKVIALPIPAQLIDAQSIEMNSGQHSLLVGLVEHMIADSSSIHQHTKDQGSTIGAVAGALGETAQSYVSSATQLAARLGVDVVDFLGGGLGTGVMQGLGRAKNPFLTVELNSQNFKEHKFEWKFSPRSPQETQVLNQIVNYFKNASLPALDGYFLKYPNMVLPMFIPNQEQLYAFKYCLITSVIANWASAGVPAFFTGTQAPAELSLALNLMEIELWFRGDSQIPGATS